MGCLGVSGAQDCKAFRGDPETRGRDQHRGHHVPHDMVDSHVPMPLNYHSEAVVIFRLLVWLTSEENTHTTGQTIYTDGGAEASLPGDNIWD